MNNKNRKIKYKRIKKSLFLAGAITTILASVISYKAGKSAGFDAGVTAEKELLSPFLKQNQEQIKQQTEEIEELEDSINSSEEKIEELIDVGDYIISKYNSLGNNLSKDDLGCIKGNSKDKIYKEDSKYYYSVYNSDHREPVETSDNDVIYIFTDNTKENIPIAGIGKINDKITDFKVVNYANNNNVLITSDKADPYVFFDDNIKEKCFENTEEYYKQRLDANNAKTM